MLRWVLAVLLLIPLLDLMVLVAVAGIIGVVPTVALVVLTALIGLLLVRAEGRHTLRRLQRTAARGEIPTDELLDGGFLIAAGAFLLTPGLVTDAVGFLLVLPPSRYLFRAGVKRWVLTPLLDARTGSFVTGEVYTAGFPGGEATDRDAYDLGDDAYDVELDDDDDGEKGNA